MSQYTYWSNYLVTKFEVNCSFIIKLANMYIISFFFLKLHLSKFYRNYSSKGKCKVKSTYIYIFNKIFNLMFLMLWIIFSLSYFHVWCFIKLYESPSMSSHEFYMIIFTKLKLFTSKAKMLKSFWSNGRKNIDKKWMFTYENPFYCLNKKKKILEVNCFFHFSFFDKI